MGIPFGFGRLAVKEQSSGWGTAETSFANANYVEAQITSPPSPMQDSEQMPVLRGDVYAPTRVAGGRAPTEIQITMPLHGFSTASPSANPTEHPDALLLRSVLGAAEQDGYHASGELSGATTSQITLGGGGGGNVADAEVGHAVLVPISGGQSIGWISVGNTGADTYDFIRNLSAAGSTSGTVYGANTVYSAVTQPTAFTLEWLGSTDNVKFRFVDCVVTSATITLETLKQPTLAVTISALDWSNVGTGGAPGAEALTDRPQMPVCISANGFRAINSAAEQKIVRATINMSATVAVDIDSSSNQGRGRFTVTDRSVTAEVTAQALSSGASTLNDPTALVAPATAAGAMQIDANTTPGRAFSVLIPAGVATATSTFGSDEDMLTITTAVECGLYTGDTSTGAVSAPANTSFRLAFL